MLLKNIRLSLIAILICGSLSAQQDMMLTHFIYNKMMVNPGKTGIDLYNGICATTMYRNQWDKVNGAPNSTVLVVEGNLTKYFPGGIGLSFANDAIGFNSTNTLYLNYSYPIQIGKFGVLGVGVGLGMLNLGMNPTWIPPTSAPDNTLPTSFSATGFDMNFGLYFQGKNFYGGISSTHLPSGILKSTDAVTSYQNAFNIARHYYFMGGYRIDKVGSRNGSVDIQAMGQTDFVKFSAQVNARYIHQLSTDKQFYGGLTFRNADMMAVMAGFTPFKNFTFGYAYDITFLNKLTSVSRGSHELVVKYCYYLPPPPKSKARHPRWL